MEINRNLGSITPLVDNNEAFLSEEQNNQGIEMMNYVTNKLNEPYSNTFNSRWRNHPNFVWNNYSNYNQNYNIGS